MSGLTTIKIVLLGTAPAVGVSNLLQTYIRLPFETERSRTASADCQMKKQLVIFNPSGARSLQREVTLRINVFDTPALESARVANLSVCRGAHCLVVVFDLSNRASFDAVEETVKIYQEAAPQAAMILVGNKSDACANDDASLKAIEEEAKILAQGKLGLGEHGYVSCSCKTDLGSVDACFDEAIIGAFEALGQEVAVVADEDDEKLHQAPAVGVKPGVVDQFAPQLVEREAVPLHPPTLVPKFREDDHASDSASDSAAAAPVEKKAVAKKEKPSSAKCVGENKVDAALTNMQLLADDAKAMLSLLKSKGFVFRGKILSTETSDDEDDEEEGEIA